MARINFRQGIVRHQTDSGNNPIFLNKVGPHVNLVVSPDFTTVNFIDGDKDYLFTESVSVSQAWFNVPIGVDSWLYWDLNKVTGIRTFGFTTSVPVTQSNPPTSPVLGQMWFNTTTFRWHEYSGASFVPVLRVFAAKLALGTTLKSVSDQTPIFTGTQVGLNTTVEVGSLAFDSVGNPIINQDGKFFTTEDVFTSGVPSGASLKINNILVRAIAQEPIGPYQVVQFTNYDKINLANPFDAVTSVYGIVERGIATGDTANVVTEGVIFNSAWDWDAAGAIINDPVYIDNTGQIVLTTSIPNQVPVAAIIGKQEILFKLGIYGFGGDAILSEHSALFGLADDDHTQYARSDGTRGNFAPLVHGHTKAEIIDFNDADYATAAQGVLADSSIQPGNNVGLLNNNVGYLTSFTETDPVYLAEKGVALGVATLDAGGLIPNAQLPPLAISDTFVVSDEPSMLVLTAETGDIAIRTDLNETYILQGTDPSVIGNWQKILTPLDAVISVDAMTGVVDLSGTYSQLIHAHVKADITDFAHTHLEVDITDLQLYLLDINSESIDELSDVDTTTVAPTDGQALAWNNTNSIWEPQTIVGGIANVVEDLTPQLGGNLDVNGNDITSIGSDINILATSTGFGAPGINIRAADSGGGFGSAGGGISIEAGGVPDSDSGQVGGSIVLTPGFDAVPTNGSSIFIAGRGSDASTPLAFNAEMKFLTIGGAFSTKLTIPTLAADTTFTFPPDNGTNGFVLTTDGAGVTTWAAGGGGEGGGGGIANVVEDLTPQLGGNLDVTGGKIFTPPTEGTQPADVIIEAGSTATFGTGGNVSIIAGGATGMFAAPGSITLTTDTNGPVRGAVVIRTEVENSPGVLHMHDGSGNVVEITAPSLAADTVFTLPPDNGTNGFVLTTDGAGVTTWGDNNVAPSSYTLLTLPPQLAGGMIFVSDATGLSLIGSQCFSNGTVWIDVTTGAAVV